MARQTLGENVAPVQSLIADDQLASPSLANGADWLPDQPQVPTQRQANGAGLIVPPSAGLVPLLSPARRELSKAMYGTAEQARPSAETVRRALMLGRHATVAETSSADFYELCLERGIDPIEHTGELRYWGAMAQHVERITEDDGTLRSAAMRLLAGTPLFLFASAKLVRSTQRHSERYEQARAVTSLYLGQLLDLTTTFTAARAAATKGAILDIANKAFVDDQTMRQFANGAAADIIRDTQHLNGFEQVLEETGREFALATSTQRTKGIDFVIDPDQRRPLKVNIRESLHASRNWSTDRGAFVLDADGIMHMYSATRDTEYGDGFYVQNRVARSRADVLNELLDQAHLLARAS